MCIFYTHYDIFFIFAAEKSFGKMCEKGDYRYEYWRPAVTVDNVVFGFDGLHLNVLLVRRGREPYKGCWAFPGGFLDEHETLEEAARRELQEETGLTPKYLTEIGSFSALDRDPRGRTITIAFASVVRPFQMQETVAGDDASACRWFPISELPQLAFDHANIIQKALFMLRIGILTDPVTFLLLDDTFTLPEMQRLYTDVFNREFDRRNFQKKFLASGMLSPVPNGDEKKNAHSPIHYRFNEDGYVQFKEKLSKC